MNTPGSPLAALSFETADTDAHFKALLEMIYQQKTAYLQPVLDLIELTWDQFGAYFRATGTAYRILMDVQLVGLCWVEHKGNVLTLLGLIIQPKYQGLGLGTQALAWLEQAYAGKIHAIELQVHLSNPRAHALYRRLGYRNVDYSEDSGFYSMRKEI